MSKCASVRDLEQRLKHALEVHQNLLDEHNKLKSEMQLLLHAGECKTVDELINELETSF